MQRPPPPSWSHGTAAFGPSSSGGGGFLPSCYLYPNVNTQFHGNIQYAQLPPGLLQPVFQNPRVVFPQNTFHRNANCTAANLLPAPLVTLETVESAAKKAHQDLLASGENVSAWKVSQTVLVTLRIDSWSSLGFQLQDIPTLNRLLLMEGKVNAFIHCFVCARKITSMHDLVVSLCQNEGVMQFEELGLGPFLQHPLVKHYFAVSANSTEVFKITTEEIILSLKAFMSKCKKVSAEEFLVFLAVQKSVSTKEKLGVRIQNLGFYLFHIREAGKAEYNLLRKKLDGSSAGIGKIEVMKKEVGSQPPNFSVEKKILDKHFNYISSCVKTFSSYCNEYGGNHVYFDSHDDCNEATEDDICSDYECDGKDKTSIDNYQNLSCVKGCGQLVSSCPYPSKTEEMMRLGLKPVESCKTSPATARIINKENKKSCRRKRKLENNNNASLLCKYQKREEAANFISDNQMCDLTLQNSDIEKFVTTWKVTFQEHSLSEVLDMMLVFYMEKVNQRKKIRKIASSYPVIGMFNVAALSIKRGMLESIYDTFQALNDNELMGIDSVASGKRIEVMPTLEVGDPTISTDSCSSVTVDDIIKKIVNYFENYELAPKGRCLSSEKLLQTLKKFYDCEMWLIAEFNVQDFCALGLGSFYDFLEKHIKLLPHGMHAILHKERVQASPVEVSLIQHQLGVMLSQAEGNLMVRVDTSTFDIVTLLKKQFPAASFCMLGLDPQKHFEELVKLHKGSINSSCVLFSACLLGDQWNHKPLIHKENSSLDTRGLVAEVAQQHSFSRTSKDAIECLLNVPMLADLLYWSHWDLIYAPSLGPLSDFLLKKVKCKNLLCIATIDGKFIRVDHTATVDEFLEAFAQCSSFNLALKFLSLLCLYKGTNNAPLALLKCYAQKAVDVIIQNSVDLVEINTGGWSSIPGHNICTCSSCVPMDGFKEYNEKCEGITFNAGICRMNNGIVTVSRTMIECLKFLPTEFRSFAAEIFLSGLRTVTKQAPTIILNQCSQTDERIMLHDVGLSLDLTEWVSDLHLFSLSGVHDFPVPSKNVKELSDFNHRNSEQDSAVSASGNHKSTLGKIEDELVGSNCRFSSAINCVTSKIVTKVVDVDERQALCLPTRTDTIISEEQSLHDATAIVESIRLEEFGLDSNSNNCMDSLLKKQHARLGRALHCLSQELYSQDSHFILELVQNADDNMYPNNVEPELVFILLESGVVILNNELGFSTENIRALCDIGNSTKKGSGGGYIGKKGIGFKSVFRVTDAPEIHSNGFHVKFDITEGQIGFVLPTVIPPCDASIFKQYLCVKNYQGNDISWNTCIILPFRSQNKVRTGVSSIISMFSDLHPSLLIFLHRLRCIKFRNLLTDKLIVMRKETLHNGIVKVFHGEEVMSFLVISKKLRSSIIRTDVEATEISMAFPLQESDCGEYKPILRNQPVFSFLPLRNYGLKFIIQGDFVLPSSREEVDGDSAWNQWLLSEFPSLFLCAEQSFCSLPSFLENPGKAVTIYMNYVPLVGEVHGFFSQLPQMIISLLRISNCLLQDCPYLTWVLPCRVLRDWNEQARLLLSDQLLQRHLGLVYMHKDIKLSDNLAMTLGIRDYGPKVLVEFIDSICRSPEDLNFLGIDWISAWLSAVYSSLFMNVLKHSSLNDELEYDILNDLKSIPFIPLSDGSYGSVVDGPIWLPCDVLKVGCKGHPENFPCLYNKLKIVTPRLFSTASKNAYSIDAIKDETIMQMLVKIGVQELSAHEVIRSYILVSLSEKHTAEDRDLMIEYLSFIVLHLQSDCVSCHSERPEIFAELQNLPVLITNHGYKCPSKEPVHFGREYGNPVDVVALFDSTDIKWVEVDTSYLKNPSSLSLPSGLMNWRSFFLELGVTDFVQVVGTEKSVEGFLSEDTMCFASFNAGSSYVKDWESPELVNLLSIFSSKKLRSKCIVLLDILDKMWDDSYSAYTKSFIISKTDGTKRPIVSSFMKSICGFAWIASTIDMDLHLPKNVFYDCEQVHSVLGAVCPYAVPQVSSKVLVNDLGFKNEVSIDDAVEILQFWRLSKSPFVARIAQMLKFYTLISSAINTSSSMTFKELLSSRFIFVPYITSYQSSSASGMFLSPKEVYWQDPTGCVDKIKELVLLYPSTHTESHILCVSLETVYPTLRDFFVNLCDVPGTPPFSSYFQILLQLSVIALPSQAAHNVFQVLVRWADDLQSGLASPDQMSELKENILKLENTVLPTEQDKWVSLHPSFGLICWPDDDELKKQFKHSDGVDFIQFGELSVEESAMLSRGVATIFRIIGVPALSEIVSREAIFYETEDNEDQVSLLNWVIPYAQRYIHKWHLDTYLKLKQLRFEKLSQLQVVVVSKLFYKYTLQGHDCASKRRFECNCLLQGNILYVCQAADAHSMFLELSRFFFNGSTELHLANFLHMTTTMAQSGSSDEQIEFFIVNSQKIPKLPGEEASWSIFSVFEANKPQISPPISDPSTGIQMSESLRRKPGISSHWPPTDWKNAPDFERSRSMNPRTRPWIMSCAQKGSSKNTVEHVTTHIEAPTSVEITANWTLEESLMPETVPVLQNTPSIICQSDSVVPSDSALEPTCNFEESQLITPSKFLDGKILRRIGRLGERLAHQYFAEKHGAEAVRWVNEETETGLPYDLVIEENEGRRYIEVKATRSANKNWFDISTREWKFAVENEDSYSIAHVSISGSNKANIAILKNPYKLCRQGGLSLALIMPR